MSFQTKQKKLNKFYEGTDSKNSWTLPYMCALVDKQMHGMSIKKNSNKTHKNKDAVKNLKGRHYHHFFFLFFIYSKWWEKKSVQCILCFQSLCLWGWTENLLYCKPVNYDQQKNSWCIEWTFVLKLDWELRRVMIFH